MEYVLPKGNERALEAQAKKLGSKLTFVYTKPQTSHALLVTQPPRHKKKNLVLYKATGNDRQAFESGRVDIIYGLEFVEHNDTIKQRKSGFNHVLAKIAVRKKVALGFFIQPLLKAPLYKRAIILGRMAQNIKLCKKYGVKVILGTLATTSYELRNPKDVEALFRDLVGY